MHYMSSMKEKIVYVIQEIPGTQSGNPKINIMGAAKYGKIEFLLPEFSQLIFSPGPFVQKLKTLLKNASEDDHYLLSGDPAIIFALGMVVGDQFNGKAKILKWDRQEKTYYPLAINLHEKGKIDE